MSKMLFTMIHFYAERYRAPRA